MYEVKEGFVKPADVRLRQHEFETAKCSFCRYFKNPFCQVLAIDVDKEQVCDAYQGDEKKFKLYKVSKKDIIAFSKGMAKLQPYKHFVIKGINTPVGPLLLIRDSMLPKPHYFSLDMGFSVEHTSREHHWMQSEVDNLIKVGKSIT